MCNADRPRGAPEGFCWADGVAPFIAGEGVKCKLPGEANWFPKFVFQPATWLRLKLGSAVAVKVSLLSDDGVENTAFGELLNMVAFIMDGDWSREAPPRVKLAGLIVCIW